MQLRLKKNTKNVESPKWENLKNAGLFYSFSPDIHLHTFSTDKLFLTLSTYTDFMKPRFTPLTSNTFSF
jgi:hypothetical protein